jgi:hypothetical protein
LKERKKKKKTDTVIYTPNGTTDIKRKKSTVHNVQSLLSAAEASRPTNHCVVNATPG